MRDKLNILFITPFLPCPGFNAGRTRMFEIIKRLSDSHNVSVISFVSKEDEQYISPLREVCHYLDVVPLTHRARGPFLRWQPGLITYFYSEKMKSKIRAYLLSKELDIAQVEYLSMSQYLSDDINVPRVLTLHELDILSLWRDMKLAPDITDRLKALPKLCKIRAYYRHISGQFNKVVVFTQKEKNILHSLFPKLSITIIPMGIDTAYFSKSYNSQEEINLLYIAYFKHRPNIDAVYYFCKKILPLIRKKYSNIKLTVVGRCIPDIFKALEGRGYLDIVGKVDDLRNCLIKSKIFVMPIITGAGMRGKLLEAFSMERAIVSTSMGCEGIDVKEGENILLGDTPLEFAQKVIRLLDNPELRKKLGRNARKTVEGAFSWDNITRQTVNEFYELIGYSSYI